MMEGFLGGGAQPAYAPIRTQTSIPITFTKNVPQILFVYLPFKDKTQKALKNVEIFVVAVACETFYKPMPPPFNTKSWIRPYARA